MKITSIETDISDGLSADKTKDTLELTKPVVQKAAEQTPKAPALPEALASKAPNSPQAQAFSAPQGDTPNYDWLKKLTIITVIFWIALVAGLLFAVLKIGANWQSYSALQWTTIIGLIIGPALLIFVAGYALKQLAEISGQAHTLAQTANALISPDDRVIGKSKIMAAAIASQVDEVNEKLNIAVGQLSSMEDVIKNQTQALDTANAGSRETVDKINASVESQNATLKSMTASLDDSMESLSTNLTMHTDNLAKSVQIAEQKIKEARISVEGATAKINSASDIVHANTVQASATLSASHEDIKSLGDIIRLRSEELDDVYKKHAGELTAMIEHLRDEQTALGASMEQRLVKMRNLSLSAQASAESLSNASKSGKETIEALAAAASLADGAVKTRFAEMRDMVQYSTEHAQSISDMAAKRVQDSLELTRKEIIRIEQEMADLQSRIGDKKHKSLELVPEEPTALEPETSDARPTKNTKKRTRLMLKPIIDIGHDKPNLDTEPDPAEEPVEIFNPEPISTIVEQTPQEQTSKEQAHQEQAPLDLGGQMIEPDMIRQTMEPLEPAPLDIPTANTKAEQTSEPTPPSADEAVRRTAPLEEPNKPKAKSGLFRNLFGGRGDEKEPSALDIVGKTVAPEPLNTNPPPTDDEILIADLAQLGLSANAVVDEGCIIEATNARAANGHEAMSRCVVARLKNPVEHLVKSLTVDDALSDKAIVFATRFDRTIELLASDREAIRTRLESEKGRAYLLCDAALNYGRV
ncbi:MAG: hypothetical protein L3J65_11920 [Robiginitomaculum sp.]|nr:hypothetical protein [Robiginitomaculum sp.]